MGSISGDEFDVSDGQESSVQEEKIFVAVRLRPLNEKEIAKGDVSDWECINSTTIVFKNNLSERSMYPNAYSFDRVYGFDSSTKQLYDEGVKGIALSVLDGINSSIFAYGQTSSGKTYTMSGITEYAITDIYDYISKHDDREFVLKFSAIEIYNECVRDLLGSDGTPLRLLDDPEKGTVVEKLTEAHLRDCSHLKELIYVCEAERQIGETALNETSSRSHQILRLAVESSPHEFRGDYSGRTLAATVNFVDLAGSERASQTLAAGARLKEGCHINRSLLTLGTVIRKLSKGGNGHVPYRNSKLTRILQNSLGGNAKTAILCTICPAHSHLEQSRNTLLFASCAKHVNTNAQVNVVMSDKALVKQLQQELARLEHELRMSPSSTGSISIIKDMELQIQKMEKEIEDLTQQRDLSQSRLEHLIRVTGIDQSSLPWADPDDLSGKGSGDGYPTSKMVNPPRFDASLKTHHLANMEGTKTLDENQHFLDENSPIPSRGSQKISQETTRNTKDKSNEDQHVNKYNTSSIEYNNIKVDQEDSRKKDERIEKTSSKDDDNITVNPEDDNKKDERIEKTSRKVKSIIMSTEESSNEDQQHIMKTSSIDDDITMNPQGKEDQGIQKTTNTHINTTINPESEEDQHIKKTSSIDENIKVNPKGNYKEDENIQKTSSIDENVTVNPESNYKDDQNIQKTSSKDENITMNPEGNYKEDLNIEKTSSIDEKVTVNPKGNYKEDQNIEKTSSIDEKETVNPEGNYKEDQNIEKTSSVDEKETVNPEGNYKEDQNIEKTSSIDEKETVNPKGNYKEDQNIEKTSSIDEKVTVNPEGNYKEDRNIQKTSSIDENVIVNTEDNGKEDQRIKNINKDLEDNYKEDEGISEEAHLDDSYGSRKKKTVDIQTTVDHAEPSPCSTDTEILSDSENILMTRSKSCSVFTVDATSSPLPPSEKEIMIKSTIINESDQDLSGKQEENKQIITKSKSEPEFTTKIRQHSPTSVDEKEMEQNMKLLVEDDVSDHYCTPKTPNALLAFNSEDASIEEMVKESEAKSKELVAPNEDWSTIFEKQRREIIRLWDACNTPLIHRTYFFLLFKGDQSDSVYMEVELRRLSFLLKTPSSVTSARALSRERIMLSKKLLKTFTAMQRDALFQKWGIPLNSKHRRIQLSRLVWTKTNDMDHIKDSAEIVAKLVGIVELNETPKELFGLSFLPNPDYQKNSFWKASMSFI